MKRVQMMRRLDRAWNEFQRAYGGLSDEQMLAPGVVGDWSVRDLLTHISSWEEEALNCLPVILCGERPPRYASLYGGIDAFNALMIESKRDLTLAEVRRQHAEIHVRLRDYIAEAPEELLDRETPFRRRIRLDTYGHYAEHTDAILAWRETNGW